MLVVNAEVIRTNPVGAQMGFLLRGIPQWDEFMGGTSIDPVKDTDWLMISGPSLINTQRDVVMVHYNAPDAVVDKAVDVVGHKYDRGGVIDAGVSGVKATLAHADRAERVILRPQPHVLAVVPPNGAEKVAKQLARARIQAHILPGEAVRLKLVNPHRPIPEIPESISELRLWVTPRADEGADVFVEGDCKDNDTAQQAAGQIGRSVREHNDMLVKLATGGLLDGVTVTSDGKLVKLRLSATRAQLEKLLRVVAGLLGVSPGPPRAAGPSAPSPRPGPVSSGAAPHP
jgi:hypothetical protein